MAVLTQTSYIRDFDVEVAQAAIIANPVVGVIQSGTVLDVTVMAVTTYRTHILRSYRDAIREISGDDPGPDPKKWKEWLEKRNQSKTPTDKATPKDKATPETGKKDTKDKN